MPKPERDKKGKPYSWRPTLAFAEEFQEALAATGMNAQDFIGECVTESFAVVRDRGIKKIQAALQKVAARQAKRAGPKGRANTHQP